jgi:hypothetical protein
MTWNLIKKRDWLFVYLWMQRARTGRSAFGACIMLAFLVSCVILSGQTDHAMTSATYLRYAAIKTSLARTFVWTEMGRFSTDCLNLQRVRCFRINFESELAEYINLCSPAISGISTSKLTVTHIPWGTMDFSIYSVQPNLAVTMKRQWPVTPLSNAICLALGVLQESTPCTTSGDCNRRSPW